MNAEDGRVVFIPDAHLTDPADDDYRDMSVFLDRLIGRLTPSDTVVIMGDLFDFWVGFRSVVPYRYLPILSRLHSLSAGGVTIHYTEGNHDFFMGPFFTEFIGAQVHTGPWELTHSGLRVYVAHGDQVNPRDRGYRFLRLVLRSLPVRVIRHLIPPFVIERIARAMSRASRVYTDTKKDDKQALGREFAVTRFFDGYDAVVLGHFHLPATWGMELSGRRCIYVNTGSWMERRQYVELYGGKFRRVTYGRGQAADRQTAQGVQNKL
jgi:UDP-2,3-diacylglucosamine hydrolase